MFITLEGIDRAGKSTQAALLAGALGEALLVREPGGTPAGERMRELLKSPQVELEPRAELLLFCAARAQLVARVIRPALEDGRDVICDRFVDSTVAYQGVARGLGAASVDALNAVAVGDCVPDVTVLLRIPPGRAADRGQQRLADGAEDGADRFEGEGLELQRVVAEAYDEIAAREPGRVKVVDAEGTVDDVHTRVMDVVRAAR